MLPRQSMPNGNKEAKSQNGISLSTKISSPALLTFWAKGHILLVMKRHDGGLADDDISTVSADSGVAMSRIASKKTLQTKVLGTVLLFRDLIMLRLPRTMSTRKTDRGSSL
jgi:hypothetical protein